MRAAIPGNKILIIVTVLLGIFCASMEAMVTATLMPSIIASMEGFELYPWLSASYLMAALAATPLFGSMADAYGYRRIYCLAVALFLLGSALCGISMTMHQLVAARAVQGLGSAGLITLSVVLFGVLFPIEKRAKMQAMLSATWAISSVLGPIVGAFCAQYLTWRWAFFINVPAAILILLAITRFGKFERLEVARHLDWSGAALFTAGLVPLVAVLLNIGQLQFGTIQLLLAIMGALFAALFLWRLLHTETPLIPLVLFHHREAVLSLAMIALAGGLLFSLINFLPLFVQGVLGEAPWISGYVVTVIAVAMFFGAVLSGLLLNRLGFRVMVVGAALLIVIGLSILVLVLPAPQMWQIITSNVITGIGLAVVANALIVAMQAIASTTTMGSASSLIHFFRMLGGTIAIALMGGVQLGAFRRSLEKWVGAEQASQMAHEAIASPQKIFDVGSRSTMGEHLGPIVEGLSSSLQDVFILCLGAAFVLLILAVQMPGLTPKQLAEFKRKKSEVRAVRGDFLEH